MELEVPAKGMEGEVDGVGNGGELEKYGDEEELGGDHHTADEVEVEEFMTSEREFREDVGGHGSE